jgi:hypothetical protein
MESVTVTLKSIRQQRAHRVQTLQHAVVALLLLFDGVEKVRGEDGHTLLGALLIVAGAALVVAIAFETLRRGRHGHGAVRWVDVFAAVMLFAEGLNKRHPGGTAQYAYYLLSALTLLMGIYHERFTSLRSVTIDDRGVSARTSPYRSFRVAWDEVSSAEIGDDAISFGTTAGREHRIKLGRLTNADEVRTRVGEALRLRGVSAHEPAQELRGD